MTGAWLASCSSPRQLIEIKHDCVMVVYSSSLFDITPSPVLSCLG